MQSGDNKENIIFGSEHQKIDRAKATVKYYEINSKVSRKKQVLDMTDHFGDFDSLVLKLHLINGKKDMLGLKVPFSEMASTNEDATFSKNVL